MLNLRFYVAFALMPVFVYAARAQEEPATGQAPIGGALVRAVVSEEGDENLENEYSALMSELQTDAHRQATTGAGPDTGLVLRATMYEAALRRRQAMVDSRGAASVPVEARDAIAVGAPAPAAPAPATSSAVAVAVGSGAAAAAAAPASVAALIVPSVEVSASTASTSASAGTGGASGGGASASSSGTASGGAGSST